MDLFLAVSPGGLFSTSEFGTRLSISTASWSRTARIEGHWVGCWGACVCRSGSTVLIVCFRFGWSQLYDYQYNMGLLLLERKTWTAQGEELKASILEAEENTLREQAAHLVALEDAGRREDVLKKSLEIEKQCVADVSDPALVPFRCPSCSAEFRVLSSVFPVLLVTCHGRDGWCGMDFASQLLSSL